MADAPDPLEVLKVREKYRLWRIVLWFLGMALVILVATVPIESVARSMAGRHTSVKLALSVTIGITLALSAATIVGGKKMLSQRGELQEQRERQERLESRIEELLKELDTVRRAVESEGSHSPRAIGPPGGQTE